MGIEPTTSSLPRTRSTTELQQQHAKQLYQPKIHDEITPRPQTGSAGTHRYTLSSPPRTRGQASDAAFFFARLATLDPFASLASKINSQSG